MQKVIIGILGFMVVIGAGAFFFALNQQSEEQQNPPSEIDAGVAAYFQEELERRVIAKGGQPIEGVNAFILLHTFPEFTAQDFDGVETLEGVYRVENGEVTYVRTKPQPITSAEEMIVGPGYVTLLKNVAGRLAIRVESAASIDSIFEALRVSVPRSSVPVLSVFETKIVYGTDASLDREALQSDCMQRGGVFKECGSMCGPDAEVCAAVCAYTCEDLEPAAIPKSGVRGQVLLGPQCPVVREGDDMCNDKPYVTNIEVRPADDASADPIVRSTDSNGLFLIFLEPGAYTLQAQGRSPFPTCAREQVVVSQDEMVSVALSCDTGIR